MTKSLYILFGDELKELGYKKHTVKHFEKKYLNYIFCVSRDVGNTMWLRLHEITYYKERKCLDDTFIKEYDSLSKNDFLYLIIETEKKYKNLIGENK